MLSPLKWSWLAVLCLCIGCGADADDDVDAGVPTDERLWRDEIVYQLLTDRFANGNQSNDTGSTCDTCYLGGDWAGIEAQLDYLEALGVTAIWISPIAQNVDDVSGDGYHGFWPLALDRANPRFGTEEELSSLVDECHARGIKVIVDVVLNHMGPVFFYDLNGNGSRDTGELAPPYVATGVPGDVVFRDDVSPSGFANPAWYHRRGEIDDFDDPEQALYGDFEGGLRDLDTSKSEVREALLSVTIDWLERVPFDGIRFDAAKHVDTEFWPLFLRDLREARPDLLSIAEVFDGDVGRLASYTGGDFFDSVLDFSSKYQAFEEVFAYGQPTSRLRDLHVSQQAGFPDVAGGGVTSAPRDILFRFLDNHDVPRFASLAGDTGRVTAALAYLLTMNGVPVLYYGTEQGFMGATDPANRETMWSSGYATDGELFSSIKRLAELRKEHRALRRGDVRFVWNPERIEPGNGAGVVAVERFVGEERALVVINSRGEAADTAAAGVGMSVGFAPGTRLVEVFSAGESVEVPADTRLTLQLAPYEVRVYVPAS